MQFAPTTYLVRDTVAFTRIFKDVKGATDTIRLDRKLKEKVGITGNTEFNESYGLYRDADDKAVIYTRDNNGDFAREVTPYSSTLTVKPDPSVDSTGTALSATWTKNLFEVWDGKLPKVKVEGEDVAIAVNGGSFALQLENSVVFQYSFS